MGCCSSSSVDLSHLPEAQRHGIAECCQAALLQQNTDTAITWLVQAYNKLGKKPEAIQNILNTDKTPVGRIANRPPTVNGHKSSSQIIQGCHSTAKMFVSAKYADDLKANKKLELKTDQQVNEFIDAAISAEMKRALEHRIDEIVNPDGQGDDENNNNMQKKQSTSNLKSQKSSSIEPTHEDKPAVSKAQAHRVASGAEKQQQSTKAKTTTTAATTKNNTTNNKANNNNASSAAASKRAAASAKKNIIEKKQEGPPPPLTGKKHDDNFWAPCDDCGYYWNAYKELYYDPVTKKFYNPEAGGWMKTEPIVIKK